MKKYKVVIERTESYSYAVVVDAKNEEEAIAKVEEKWDEDDYLYEKTTDCPDTSETNFSVDGIISNEEADGYTVHIS